MAEREGFEPSIRDKPYTPLAGERLQPLGHLSFILDLVMTAMKYPMMLNLQIFHPEYDHRFPRDERIHPLGH